VMAGGKRITMIAVAGGDGDLLCTPCGACRQRIREFGAGETPVLVGAADGLQRRFTLDELLPESFGPENLAD
jgi:cytidine deaminase